MRRYILCLSLALVVVAGAVLYAQPAPEAVPAVSAQVVGLQVGARIPGDDMMMQPFHSAPGVALAVLIRSTRKTIVAFDDDASSLDVLQDDRGKDLKTASAGASSSGPMSLTTWQPDFSFPQISKDGKAVLVDLRGGGVPSAGSTRIRAQGTAVVKVGTTLETARQVNVPLRKGTKITAGPVLFTVQDVADGGAFGAAMTLTLTADQDLDAISDMTFQDASGAEIETQNAGMVSSSSMGRVSVQKQISFNKKVGSATVVGQVLEGPGDGARAAEAGRRPGPAVTKRHSIDTDNGGFPQIRQGQGQTAFRLECRHLPLSYL